MIIKVSLPIFLITFVLAYILDINHELPIIKIEEIDEKHIGKHVKISGIIVRQTLIGNNLFSVIEDETSRINIVAFKAENELNIGEEYIVQGRVDSYRQNLQIIANKIIVK